MRKLPLLAASILLVLAPQAWAYDIFTGKVTTMHLNVDAPGRGACIKLFTTAGQSPWACLNMSRALHDEMFAMLKTAYNDSRTCTIWVEVAVPYNEIKALECS